MYNLKHEVLSYNCSFKYVLESTLFPIFVPSSHLIPQLVDYFWLWINQLKFLLTCLTLDSRMSVTGVLFSTGANR